MKYNSLALSLQQQRQTPATFEPQFRLARDFGEFCRALRLVHDRYVQTGLTDPNETKLRVFLRDLIPSSAVMIAAKDPYVYGTASINIFRPASLPCSSMYKAQLDELVRNERKLAEGTKLACAAVTSLESDVITGLSQTAFNLLKMLFYWCLNNQVTDWLIVIHPRLIGLYRDELGFELVGTESSCPHVKGRPGVLLRMDMDRIRMGNAICPFILRGSLPKFTTNSLTTEFSHQLSDFEISLLLLDNIDILNSAPEEDIQSLILAHPQIDLSLIRRLGRDNSHTGYLHKHSLLNGLFQLEHEQSGVKIRGDLTKTKACFALRAHLERIVLALHSLAKEKGSSVTLSIKEDVPDSILSDPHLITRSLFTAVISILDSHHNFNENVKQYIRIEVDCYTECNDKIVLELTIKSSQNLNRSSIEHELLAYTGLRLDRHRQFENNTFRFAIGGSKIELAPFLNRNFNEHRIDNTFSYIQRLKPIRVLIVDDSIVSQLTVRRQLKKLGMQVTVANDGVEALVIAEKAEFDLILLNLQLLNLNGQTLCQMIRAREKNLNRPKIPIYALAKIVSPEERDSLLQTGITGFLDKPLCSAALMKILKVKHKQLADIDFRMFASA